MNWCSIVLSQLDPFSIGHNNSDDKDGQGDDHDIYHDLVQNFC